MANLNDLYNLPEISLLDEEGITLDSMQQEMIADFETDYEDQTGESLTLYPADPWRLALNAASAKMYQLAAIMDAWFKQNFLMYMTLNSTRQWGGNFGYFDTGEECAKCTERFTLSEIQPNDVEIPQGTQVTAGDDIFFATDEAAVVVAGTAYVDVPCTCTEPGAAANNYIIGAINILSNTINYIDSVENIDQPSGGRDAYTNEELKEKILNFPDTYSVAGPSGAYEQMVYAYSDEIISTRAIADDEGGTVLIYVMLENKTFPDSTYCDNLKNYIKESKRFPDTDQLVVAAPTQVSYTLEATYYISEYNKEVEDTIKAAVEQAVEEFTNATASEIGKAVVPDDLISYIKAAGARRITIVSPSYTSIGENEIAICTNVQLTYGGLEDE